MSLAIADDEGHPPEHQSLHDKFYADWRVPNAGEPRIASCCNKHDCYPTKITFDPYQRKWLALRREDSVWVTIPDDRLEQKQTDEQPSPDHQSHACIRPPHLGGHVVCATLGSRSEQ